MPLCPAKLTTYLLSTVAVAHVVLCIRSLSQLKSSVVPGLSSDIRCNWQWLCCSSLNFSSKERHLYEIIMTISYIYIYVVSVLFPFILVCSRLAGAMSVYFLSQSVQVTTQAFVLPRSYSVFCYFYYISSVVNPRTGSLLTVAPLACCFRSQRMLDAL